MRGEQCLGKGMRRKEGGRGNCYQTGEIIN